MSKITDNVMKEVSQLSLQYELNQLEELDSENLAHQPLSTDDIKKLALYIERLPSEYKIILFFRYCFDSNFAEINKVLEIENSVGKSRYTEKMLSNIMGLKSQWIDGKAIQSACKLALIEDMKDYNNIETKNKPNYTMNFRRKLRKVGINRNISSKLKLITKRVAIFVLICLLSFSTVLAVNAKVRERVLDWIIEVFPKFSIFTSDSSDDLNGTSELTEFHMDYIPKGFKLIDKHEGRTMLIYNYESETQQLEIKLFDINGEGRSYYDTEDAEIEEITIRKSQGYTWERDGITYLILNQDGIEYHVVGNLKLNEIIKIAENISK